MIASQSASSAARNSASESMRRTDTRKPPRRRCASVSSWSSSESSRCRTRNSRVAFGFGGGGCMLRSMPRPGVAGADSAQVRRPLAEKRWRLDLANTFADDGCTMLKQHAQQAPDAPTAPAMPLMAAADLQDNLMTATNDLDRLQGLLSHACDELMQGFHGAAGEIQEL